MNDKDAMAMALDALEYWDVHGKLHQPTEEAITALKERLAQPEQEPMAWMRDVNNGGGYTSKGIGFMQTNIPFAKHTSLFTTPPQRTEQEPVAVKRMKEWVEFLKRQSDNGQHMNIPSSFGAGTCWELAIELEQFINTTPQHRTEPPQQKKVWTFWDLSGGDITDAIKAKLKEKNQ